MTANIPPISDRNIILTGYTGPNQPFIARGVAGKLGWTLVNVEQRIADLMGLSMDEIRLQYGQQRLKTIEAEIVQEMVLHRRAVIRVSGHTLINGDALARFQENGVVICLVASLDAVLQRLHVALGARYHNPNERALALGNLKREWSVRGAAGVLEIDTTYQREAETVDAVIALWGQHAIVRG